MLTNNRFGTSGERLKPVEFRLRLRGRALTHGWHTLKSVQAMFRSPNARVASNQLLDVAALGTVAKTGRIRRRPSAVVSFPPLGASADRFPASNPDIGALARCRPKSAIMALRQAGFCAGRPNMWSRMMALRPAEQGRDSLDVSGVACACLLFSSQNIARL